MTGSSTITLIKKLDITDLSGEKVMIDFETGKYFLLKGAANEIWEYIQTPIQVEKIIAQLMDVYDVSREICQESTVTFLQQLLDYNFIKVENN